MTFTVNGGISPAPNTRVIKSPWDDIEETRDYASYPISLCGDYIETYTIDASTVPPGTHT